MNDVPLYREKRVIIHSVVLILFSQTRAACTESIKENHLYRSMMRGRLPGGDGVLRRNPCPSCFFPFLDGRPLLRGSLLGVGTGIPASLKTLRNSFIPVSFLVDYP